jgi:hypothetical protein
MSFRLHAYREKSGLYTMTGKGLQKSLRAGRVRPIVKGENHACSRPASSAEGPDKITKPDYTDSQAE